MNRAPDNIGTQYSRLVIVAPASPSGSGATRWACRCSCGRETIVAQNDLRNGKTKSCGCKRRERDPAAICHKAEFKIWAGILARCNNPNVKKYPEYGGRAIKVADEWLHNFRAFYSHVGERPSSRHSIDRIETDGDYRPGNVRWALPEVQANNRRTTRRVIYRGRSMALTDAVRAGGSVIHYEAAWVRIRSGWSVERAVETPRLHESPNSKERKLKKRREAATIYRARRAA